MVSLPFFKVSENIPAEIYFKGVSFFIKSCSNLRQTEEQQAEGILQLANVPYFIFQQRILTITHCVGKPHDDNINSLMQAKDLQTFLNQHKHIPKSVCRPADMRSLCFPRSLAQGWLCLEPRVSVKDQRRARVHCCKAPATPTARDPGFFLIQYQLNCFSNNIFILPYGKGMPSVHVAYPTEQRVP